MGSDGEGVGVGSSGDGVGVTSSGGGDGASGEGDGDGVSTGSVGRVVVTPLTIAETRPSGDWPRIWTLSPVSKRDGRQGNVTRSMSSHTEDVADREATMKGDSGWRILDIQPLLVGGGPPETGRCRRKMSKGEGCQQDEGEKTIHRQAPLA